MSTDNEKYLAKIEACRRGGKTRAQQATFKEAQRKGGKARAQQESFVLACQKGFAVTVDRYPWMANVLKSEIAANNHAKGEALGLTGAQYRAQRIQETGAQGLRSPEEFN